MTLPLDDTGLPLPGRGTPSEGWVTPLASKLKHYVVKRDSLCGLWVNVVGDYKPGLAARDQSFCVRCVRLLERRRTVKWFKSSGAGGRWLIHYLTETGEDMEESDEMG